MASGSSSAPGMGTASAAGCGSCPIGEDEPDSAAARMSNNDSIKDFSSSISNFLLSTKVTKQRVQFHIRSDSTNRLVPVA